jgi:hypothetical protein
MIGCVNNYGHVLFLQYHGKYTENQDDKYTMVANLYPHMLDMYAIFASFYPNRISKHHPHARLPNMGLLN